MVLLEILADQARAWPPVSIMPFFVSCPWYAPNPCGMPEALVCTHIIVADLGETQMTSSDLPHSSQKWCMDQWILWQESAAKFSESVCLRQKLVVTFQPCMRRLSIHQNLLKQPVEGIQVSQPLSCLIALNL